MEQQQTNKDLIKDGLKAVHEDHQKQDGQNQSNAQNNSSSQNRIINKDALQIKSEEDEVATFQSSDGLQGREHSTQKNDLSCDGENAIDNVNVISALNKKERDEDEPENVNVISALNQKERAES